MCYSVRLLLAKTIQEELWLTTTTKKPAKTRFAAAHRMTGNIAALRVKEPATRSSLIAIADTKTAVETFRNANFRYNEYAN